jgi:hypothetical protein
MEANDNQREDRILNSLGGLQKASAPDFFYTRLIGRMQAEAQPVKQSFFLLRPAFITTALAIVLVVNLVSLKQETKQPEQKATTVESGKPASIESFAAAYGLESESVYE